MSIDANHNDGTTETPVTPEKLQEILTTSHSFHSTGINKPNGIRCAVTGQQAQVELSYRTEEFGPKTILPLSNECFREALARKSR